MSLIDKLKSDVNEAVKAQDSVRVETLRGVVSSIHNEEISMRANSGEITDEGVLKVIQKEAKKRKEAIDVYTKAERPDLADKEKEELNVILEYLPEEISEEEVRNIVSGVIESIGSEDFGKIMQVAIREVAGRAESSVVSNIVRDLTKDS